MSDRVPQKSSEPNPEPNESRPTKVLEGVGLAAWQAFNAMQATKTRHIELLEYLDARRERYRISPSEADRRLLRCLLADHDVEVMRFRDASTMLRESDPDAHRQLFDYIGFVNGAIGRRTRNH